jgi:anti-sigma regulatory factor (Ser/Thr protein kinase)
LERLAAALADTVTLDDTARAVLGELLEVDEVFRVGVALSQGAGRELRFVSSDEDKLGPHWVRWCTIDGLSDVPLARTVRTGEPVYLSQDRLERDHPGLGEKNRGLGSQAVATVPLLVDGTCLGGLLVTWSTPQEWSTQQQGFLAAFAAQAAQAVRRGMAYHEQRTTSGVLQRSLLPHSLPDIPGLDFGAHYSPGSDHVDVGGDWYDVMPLPDGSVAVSLGDVMGKGVAAAVVMNEVRTAARAYVLLDPDPSTVLSRLDRLVTVTSGAEQVVTMVYGVVDPSRTSLRLAVAGHPPPLVIPPQGSPAPLSDALGPALGIEGDEWTSTVVPLEEGAGVLFYSDGLVESRDRDLVDGIEHLRETVTSLDDRRRRNSRELCARVADSLVPSGSGDDVTLLAVTSVPPRTTASGVFPGDPSAPSAARAFVREVLEDWGCDEDLVERARICVSELVTNAIIHAGSQTTVTLQSDGSHLSLLVHDQGGHDRVRPADDAPVDGVSGRGLSIVDALSSSWSVEQSTDGTLVWCELDLDGSTAWADLAS